MVCGWFFGGGSCFVFGFFVVFFFFWFFFFFGGGGGGVGFPVLFVLSFLLSLVQKNTYYNNNTRN